MRIDQLQMANFRQFENLTVEFSPHFNIVIGENGSGKSSLLDALAIGFSTFLFKMGGGRKAQILVNDIRLATYEQSIEYQLPTTLSYSGEIGCNHEEWSVKKEHSEEVPNNSWNKPMPIVQEMRQAVTDGQKNIVPVVAYFPAPRMWQVKGELGPTKPTSRLFPYHNALDPINHYKTFLEWFTTKEFAATQTKRRGFHELEVVRRAVTNCVEECKGFYHDFDWGFLVIEMEDGSIMPIDRLSDGLKNMLAMVGDIAYRCYSHNPYLGQEALTSPGVVLIDELDLHLHPRWQQHVVRG